MTDMSDFQVDTDLYELNDYSNLNGDDDPFPSKGSKRKVSHSAKQVKRKTKSSESSSEEPNSILMPFYLLIVLSIPVVFVASVWICCTIPWMAILYVLDLLCGTYLAPKSIPLGSIFTAIYIFLYIWGHIQLSRTKNNLLAVWKSEVRRYLRKRQKLTVALLHAVQQIHPTEDRLMNRVQSILQFILDAKLKHLAKPQKLTPDDPGWDLFFEKVKAKGELTNIEELPNDEGYGDELPDQQVCRAQINLHKALWQLINTYSQKEGFSSDKACQQMVQDLSTIENRVQKGIIKYNKSMAIFNSELGQFPSRLFIRKKGSYRIQEKIHLE